MKHVDRIIHARWVLPIIPKNTVLEHHAIAIDNDRIVDILPSKEVSTKYTSDNIHEQKSHVLMPGLINTHAHTPMNIFKGLADDLELMNWLENHIWPSEQKILASDSVYHGSMLAIAEMIRGGTTCFNDHYFFPNETAAAAIQTGIRACIGLWVGSVPTGWAQNAEEYMEKARIAYHERDNNPLITYAMAPHSPYVNDDHSLKLTKAFADEHNLRIHIHLHETQTELEINQSQFNNRPLARFESLGLLNERLIAVHMVHLTDDEIAKCRETGVNISHNPESNLKLASGFAPIQKLLNAGVNVSLGTDGAASNNDLDMFGELRTAALIAKGLTQDPTALDATTALEMATINGAKTMGLEKETGSIEIGKYADVIAVDLDHLFTQPIYNIASHLAYAVNRLQVSDVWVAGKQLLSNGEFTTLDQNKVVADSQQWAKQAMPFRSLASTQK